jgi:hypothetical protein
MDHSKDWADQRYSGLEMVPISQPEADQRSSGLEVVPISQPEADQLAYPEIVQEPEVLRSFWRRKWGWVFLFGVLVIAAILVGVLLVRH